MSGDAQIARRIGTLETDAAVKKCLLGMFTHELSNADKAMPQYRADYERLIGASAKAWIPESDGVDSL